MPKKIIVLLAEGFEEVEAITPIDYLRRVGIEVTTVAIGAGAGAGGNNRTVTGSHSIQIAADDSLDNLLADGKLDPAQWDAVVVPGGLPGSDNLASSKTTGTLLKGMAEAGKWICAICAAPARVLSPLGLLAAKNFTCYPGEKENSASLASPGAEWKNERVVIDGNIITSQGAGTAGEFACAIIAKLISETEAEKLAGRVLL